MGGTRPGRSCFNRRASMRPLVLSDSNPQLLSRSCTTGWFDWVWGDLWLTRTGLVRLSRGWAETRRAARDRSKRGGGSTVDPSTAAAIAEEALRQRVADDAKNRWVAIDEIRAGRLRQGIMNGGLAVELQDETRVKLLWLKHDPAFDVLEALLAERLGGNLRVG